MIIDLPYPHKALWPNGRAHFMAKGREVKKHRDWAHVATLAAMGGNRFAFTPPLAINIEVRGRSRGALPDADNCVAASKVYLDGIADALKVNDRYFAAPTITYGPRTSRFIITVGK